MCFNIKSKHSQNLMGKMARNIKIYMGLFILPRENNGLIN